VEGSVPVGGGLNAVMCVHSSRVAGERKKVEKTFSEFIEPLHDCTLVMLGAGRFLGASKKPVQLSSPNFHLDPLHRG
jgi:hypothetical protein